MQQRTKRKTHSERAWEAYQKEKRLRKMRQEELIRRYKFILAGLNLSESRARRYVATWKLCLTLVLDNLKLT